MVFRGWVRCCALGLAISSQSRTALCQRSRRFSLEYQVAPDCPDRAQAVTSIVKRNGSLLEVGDAPAASRFRIVITAEQRQFVGRLEQPEHGAVRRVAGSDCAKVVEALALVLALAATADSAGGSEPTEPPEGQAESDGLETAPQPPPRGEARRKESVETTEAPAGSATTAVPGLGWALGVGGSSIWGRAPMLLAGPALTLERSHEQGWLFVRLVGRLGYGLRATSNRLADLVPELGLRRSLGAVELSLQAGLGFGTLVLEHDTGLSKLWVTPVVGPTLRVRPSPNWWFEFGAEAGFPLVARRARLVGSDTVETDHVVFGATIFGGFGKVKETRIGSASSGHSWVQ
jgi:hypothetical protein